MDNQRTIVKGLLTVPIADQYIFKRSPEIMEWFATLGYGFHGRHDADQQYACIVYTREQNRDFGFANSDAANSAMLRERILDSSRYFDITLLILEHLNPVTSTKEYEYW